MPWERRRTSGHQYYTRSLNVDGRRIRLYIGRGPLAEQIAAADAQRQAERRAIHGAARTRKAELAAAAAPLADLTDCLDLLTTATLLSSGYHRADRHWRRRHDHNPVG